MDTTTFKTLRKAAANVSEKPLLGVYLLQGEDSLKREMLLERLMDRIAQQGDLSMNMQVFNAKDIKDATQMLDALNTMPFGSPVRLVIIKEVSQLNKGMQDRLVSYIKQPLASTVLAMTASKLDARSSLYKAVLATSPLAILDCAPKRRSEMFQLVQNIAAQQGVSISFIAAKDLVERVDGETVMLHNETKKLCAIIKSRGGTQISEKDVAQYVARQSEPKPWELANALALRDTSLCLKLIGRMRSYTAVGLFTQCTSRIREILTALIVRQRGQSVAQALHKQDWQIKEVLKACELYRQDELVALLKEAPHIEARMKSGADAQELLKLWVINACTRVNAFNLH